MSLSSETLPAQECRLLHRHLFGVEASSGIVRHYEALHLLRFSGPDEERLTRLLATARPDVGALEYALRLRDRRNGLTRRMASLCYLHEAETPATEGQVEAPGFLRAVLVLGAFPFIASWKLLKGLALVRRHGLGR